MQSYGHQKTGFLMGRVNIELILNAEERKIYLLLKTVKGQSPYAIKCRMIKTKEELYQMINHFYQQSKTSFWLTEEIIGKTALESVIAFKGAMALDGQPATVS
jgi:hypothetical protein